MTHSLIVHPRHTQGPYTHPQTPPPRSPFVIFLDIDGVLLRYPLPPISHEKIISNVHESPDPELLTKHAELFPGVTPTHFTLRTAATHFFAPHSLSYLKFLLDAIEQTRPVKIVISSAWRERPIEETDKEPGYTRAELRELFKAHAFANYIIGRTPSAREVPVPPLFGRCKKATCIDPRCRGTQIKAWLEKHPEVFSFAVIDDSDLDLRCTFGRRFFPTHPYFGLNFETALEIAKLGKEKL